VGIEWICKEKFPVFLCYLDDCGVIIVSFWARKCGIDMASKQQPIIRFDDDDIEEVTALANNCDKLPEVISKGAQIGPRLGTIRITRQLSKEIALDFSELHSVVNALVQLYRMRDGHSDTSEIVAETVSRSLEKANRMDAAKVWKDAQNKIVSALNELNDEHPFVVSYEAGATSFPNSIYSLELSTGTRPVFNESKDKVLFTIISHTLSLDYHEGYRNHKEVHLNLDADDLAMLRVLCEEAEQAAETLRASINGPSAYRGEDE
jgi:hypothetical protein